MNYLPPLHDLDAEKLALGFALESGEVDVRVSPRAFFIPEHRWIWAHLLEEKRPAYSALRVARTCMFLEVVSGVGAASWVDLVHDLHAEFLCAPVHKKPDVALGRVVELHRLRQAERWLSGIAGSIRAGEMSLSAVRRELRKAR
jgi:hypothetical protein